MNYLDQIRLGELDLILRELERYAGQRSFSDIKILEIGAGSGAQTKKLRELGFNVTAIDIAESNHSKKRIIDIIEFDGVHLPFADYSFDIVYSSNVLEHVIDKDGLNKSIKKVLRSNGIALHYVPSEYWRIWSIFAFYPSLIKKIIRKVGGKLSNKTMPHFSQSKKITKDKIKLWMFPSVHGTSINVVSEISDFTERSWNRFFLKYGWAIVKKTKNNLFLTGEMLMGEKLSLKQRIRLSIYLGSTAYLYVLKNE